MGLSRGGLAAATFAALIGGSVTGAEPPRAEPVIELIVADEDGVDVGIGQEAEAADGPRAEVVVAAFLERAFAGKPFFRGPAMARVMAKPAAAEEKKDDKDKKKEEEDEAVIEVPVPRRGTPDGIILHLMDGSVIAGKMTLDEIQVTTDFGPLKVPVKSIKTFTPGLGSHPELAAKIKDLIEDLGSSDFAERETAQKRILEMGVSVRAELESRTNDPDVERRARVRKILAELDQAEAGEDQDFETQAPVSRGVLIHRDTIETTEFTIVGQIVPQKFQVLSKYGPLGIELADIRKAERDQGGRPELRKTMGVDGANLVQNNCKSTGIRVVRGDRISITAEGNITMTPWGNEAVTTPDGAANYGWYIPGQIPGGALCGKIGDGQVFKIGSKSSFTAERSGTLELGVAVQNDYVNNMFPGRYTVRIRVKPKE